MRSKNTFIALLVIISAALIWLYRDMLSKMYKTLLVTHRLNPKVTYIPESQTNLSFSVESLGTRIRSVLTKFTEDIVAFQDTSLNDIGNAVVEAATVENGGYTSTYVSWKIINGYCHGHNTVLKTRNRFVNVKSYQIPHSGSLATHVAVINVWQIKGTNNVIAMCQLDCTGFEHKHIERTLLTALANISGLKNDYEGTGEFYMALFGDFNMSPRELGKLIEKYALKMYGKDLFVPTIENMALLKDTRMNLHIISDLQVENFAVHGLMITGSLKLPMLLQAW